MNNETRQLLKAFQEDLREKARNDEISYSRDDVYGMAIMLESVLNETLSVSDAMEEFIENSDLEIQVDTQVVTQE